MKCLPIFIHLNYIKRHQNTVNDRLRKLCEICHMDKIERKMEKYRKMFLFQYSVILTLSNENALLFLKKVLKTII